MCSMEFSKIFSTTVYENTLGQWHFYGIDNLKPMDCYIYKLFNGINNKTSGLNCN